MALLQVGEVYFGKPGAETEKNMEIMTRHCHCSTGANARHDRVSRIKPHRNCIMLLMWIGTATAVMQQCCPH